MLLKDHQTPEILSAITNYWDDRAKGYNETNQAELQCFKRDVWKKIILEQVSNQQKIKILDVGCGPGFFALIMAEAGHIVTAVDATQNMLEEAKQNAQRLGVKIEFLQSDAHQLLCADASFDLVITRNLTWNLYEPREAYEEWFRVLKPGGKLINFDANWYLHLFDPVLHQQFAMDRANTKAKSVQDHYINTDTKTMTAIALQLPLSQILRPQWDVQTLKDIGFTSIETDLSIGKVVWDDEEKLNYGSTPMFMIIAKK